MKDYIKRISIILITGILICYFGYLLFTGQTIVTTEYIQSNTLYLIILMIVNIYIMVIYGVYPLHIKFSKPLLFFVGIIMIVISNVVLINDGKGGIFVGDIVSIFGVVLTLLSWTNLLISNKILKKRDDKKVEIIEV